MGAECSVPLTLSVRDSPKVMSQVLIIVHRMISTYQIKAVGKTVKSGAQRGTVTLILI
jgi:hypothetical protein